MSVDESSQIYCACPLCRKPVPRSTWFRHNPVAGTPTAFHSRQTNVSPLFSMLLMAHTQGVTNASVSKNPDTQASLSQLARRQTDPNRQTKRQKTQADNESIVSMQLY